MSKVYCYQQHGGTCRQPVAEPNYTCRYPGHNKGQAHMHGKAGGSLRGQAAQEKYGSAGKAGFKGEQIVSKFLWETFKTDPAIHIFQDVSIPEAKGANADFVVIKGHRVLIVDAKMWAPGFYWSSFWRKNPLPHKGATLKPFEAATGHNDKGQIYTSRTVAMAVDIYTKQLIQRAGSGWKVSGAYLFVPPDSRPEAWRNMKVWALNLHGARRLVAGDPRTPKKMLSLMSAKADDNNTALEMFHNLTR